jgi:hypothetical protein
VSQSSEFCYNNTFCCFSTSGYCCKRIFRHRLIPETFGHTVVHADRFFSRMKQSKSKFRLRITSANLHDVRIDTSNIKLNVNSLAEQNQAQVSH